MYTHEPEGKIEFPLLMHEIRVLPIKLLGLFLFFHYNKKKKLVFFLW